jgi:hypothetical protein
LLARIAIMSSEEIRDLEERIAELRKRIPPHSVPPAMLQELDELEEQLEKARGQERED